VTAILYIGSIAPSAIADHFSEENCEKFVKKANKKIARGKSIPEKLQKKMVHCGNIDSVQEYSLEQCEKFVKKANKKIARGKSIPEKLEKKIVHCGNNDSIQEFSSQVCMAINSQVEKKTASSNDVKKFLAYLEICNILYPPDQSCSSGWYVTGYYTPHESDFSGKIIQINVYGNQMQVKKKFVNEIKIEGWGKLESGPYLGWYDSMYHLSPDPLDAHDTALSESSLAADTNEIPQGSLVSIPSLPSPRNEFYFTVNDVGPSIQGKHVDVYTGEGQIAYEETLAVTGYDNIVCVVESKFYAQ